MTSVAESSDYVGRDRSWSRSVDEVLAELAVDPTVGLDTAEADRRRVRFGRNQLRAAKRRSVASIFLDQFKSVVILLLVAAGGLAVLFAEPIEGLAIFAVIAINATIGFFTEWRAVRSMEALGRLGRIETVVIREGLVKRVPAEGLVPGDIVICEGGDIVTADMRLIEAAKLQADESTLTGESMPVTKMTEPLPTDTPVMDRQNIVFKGTAITRGSGKGIVIGTGLSTELGRISELVTEAEAQQTPLEKRLDALAQRLVWAVLVLGLLIAAAGVLAGRDTYLAIEVAIALAVAAIPEGLPIVATIALARGMWRMAKQNALIARLSAVETLGATSVILTDKTGTLTENRMTVTAVRTADADIAMAGSGSVAPAVIAEGAQEPQGNALSLLDELLTAATLCSNASLSVEPEGAVQGVGDPTEVALLIAAAARNIRRDALLEQYPEVLELAFDPETKRMATLHAKGDATLVAVKGAPETVIPICSSVLSIEGAAPLSEAERRDWAEHAARLGERGLRTLAVAQKTTSNAAGDAYADLMLIGIVGLEDPPRRGVKDAIRQCRDAGISVVMVTGDHAATAQNVATELDIVAAGAPAERFVEGADLARFLADADLTDLEAVRVFSRVSPEQKLDLIDFYQQHEQVVAMTGDGVNDAPALKKADIGVAMGIRGTAVAKEAAAMVLEDDEFPTIVRAVAQGRTIYENIRKFVVYLLSCNISEVLVVSIATIVGAPLPLLPLQILFLNLVTDVFPALALGVGEGSPVLMKAAPRPFDEPVLTGSHWTRILLHGFVIAATVLSAMAIAVFQLGFDADHAVTVSFCTLAFAQVWHVFNMRDDIRRLIKNEITRNPWIWAAVAVCILFVLAAVYLPLPRDLLKLSDPGAAGWLVIIGMSFVPLAVAPIVRLIAPRGLAP